MATIATETAAITTSRQSARAVIPTIMSQIANGHREIKLGALTPTRDFSFVADTVAGFIAALRSDRGLGEGHAEPLGLMPRTAVTEDIRARAALRADEGAHAGPARGGVGPALRSPGCASARDAVASVQIDPRLPVIPVPTLRSTLRFAHDFFRGHDDSRTRMAQSHRRP